MLVSYQPPIVYWRPILWKLKTGHISMTGFATRSTGLVIGAAALPIEATNSKPSFKAVKV